MAFPRHEVTVVSHASQRPSNALVRRSIDLRALYRRAATEVCEPGLRTILEENAQSLSQLICELQLQMGLAEVSAATGNGALDVARRSVGLSFAVAMTHGDDAWIRRLAREEARICKSFEKAVESASPELLAVLLRQGSRLHAIHLDMHSLTKAVGH